LPASQPRDKMEEIVWVTRPFLKEATAAGCGNEVKATGIYYIAGIEHQSAKFLSLITWSKNATTLICHLPKVPRVVLCVEGAHKW